MSTSMAGTAYTIADIILACWAGDRTESCLDSAGD